MNGELDHIAAHIRRARAPEEVFGELQGTNLVEQLANLKRVFRHLALKTHPDEYPNSSVLQQVATDAFEELTRLRVEAETKIKRGTYGSRDAHAAEGTPEAIVIHTKTHTFAVGNPLARGDLADLYHCTYPEGGESQHAIFKIAQEPVENDLLANEARVLTRLWQDPNADQAFHKYLPQPIESLIVGGHGQRRANVLSYLDGYYPLTAVRNAYPSGIDFRDMAWMWRRLLVVMGFASREAVVHGAVIPPHVLINPTTHGLALIDWSYAVMDPRRSGERVRAMSTAHEAFYAPEILSKQSPTPAADIFMAAKCMLDVLGGNVEAGEIPKEVPRPIRVFFASCLVPARERRPDDAWTLYDEFDVLLRRLVGPPKFRPFVWPDASI